MNVVALIVLIQYLKFEQLKRASEVPVESVDHMDNNPLIRGSQVDQERL